MRGPDDSGDVKDIWRYLHTADFVNMIFSKANPTVVAWLFQ